MALDIGGLEDGAALDMVVSHLSAKGTGRAVVLVCRSVTEPGADAHGVDGVIGVATFVLERSQSTGGHGDGGTPRATVIVGNIGRDGAMSCSDAAALAEALLHDAGPSSTDPGPEFVMAGLGRRTVSVLAPAAGVGPTQRAAATERASKRPVSIGLWGLLTSLGAFDESMERRREGADGFIRLEDQFIDPLLTSTDRSPDRTYTTTAASLARSAATADTWGGNAMGGKFQKYVDTWRWAVDLLLQKGMAGGDVVVLVGQLAGEAERMDYLRSELPRIDSLLGDVPGLEEQWAGARTSLAAADTLFRSSLGEAGLLPWSSVQLAQRILDRLRGRAGVASDGHIPVIGIEAACAGTGAGVDIARSLVRAGVATRVLLVCMDLPANERDLILCSGLGILSKGRMRVFEESSDGFTAGEACAVFSIGSDHSEESLGLSVTLEAVGYSNDRHSMVAPSPKGQLLAIQRAAEDGLFPPGAAGPDLIEVHGTGTREGDRIELETIRAAYGTDPARTTIPLAVTKSTFGHCFSAAGAVSLADAIWRLNSDEWLPTPSDRELVLSTMEVSDRNRKAPPESGPPMTTAINMFGTGGINYHLRVGRIEPK